MEKVGKNLKSEIWIDKNVNSERAWRNSKLGSPASKKHGESNSRRWKGK